MKFLLNATAWENGCGLATISHALSPRIFTTKRELPNERAINTVLNAFSTVYQVPELSCSQLRKLLHLYQHPEDQQKIWIGPLRQILSEKLLSHTEYRDTLFHVFVTGLRHYVLEERPTITDEYANIYQTNPSFFEFARASYWRVRAVRRVDKERDIFQTTALQAYWQQIGYVLYCHQHKQITDNPLMLTAEEMSQLCETLEIALHLYERGRTNHTCKGFEGENPLASLSAICTNHHWQPITSLMSKAFQQQLLWKNGFRHFANHSYEALKQAVRADLLTKSKRFTAPLLHKAIVRHDYASVANICQRQADKPDPDNGFYHCIDNAISHKDFSALLTLYHFKPNTRNTILNKSLRNHGTAFIAVFLKYYQTLPKNITDTQHWENELEKVIPCIHKIQHDSDLHTAIRKGETDEAKKLIAEETDIYLENDCKISPLHLVCEKENQSLLKIMSDIALSEHKKKDMFRGFFYFGLDLYRKDASGKTPMHYAASGTSPTFARMLLALCDKVGKHPSCLNVVDESGKTPIHIAAVNTHQPMLPVFLKSDYLVQGAYNAQDKLGLTPLHYAAAIKNVANVRLLLQAGAHRHINAYADKVKEVFPQFNSTLTYLTPLWIALELNDLETARHLIVNTEHLIRTKNSQGLNVVQMAIRQGRVELLNEWNTHTFWHWYLADEQGKTLLHHAAEAGQLEALQHLEAKGLWFSKLDAQANSVLHLAAQKGQLRVVDYLCDKAVRDSRHNQSLKTKNTITQFFKRKRDVIELDARNADGETPYALALIYGHTDVAQRLRSAGASPVSLQETLLHAIYRADNQAMEDKIASIVSKRHTIGLETDSQGDSLIHHAIKGLHYRALRLLLHPLKVAERQTVCLMENHDRLKSLDLINQLRQQGILRTPAKGNRAAVYQALTKDQRKVLDKIERALIGYHRESYERKYRTLAQKAQYRLDCAMDLKEEIQRSSGYYYGSMASMMAIPLFEAAQISIHPWSLMETAVSAYFGKNPIDMAERGAAMLARHYPESTFLYYADWFLWGLGWYRHTMRNMAGEVAKWTSSMALSEMGFDEYQLLSKNYLSYLNTLGVAHAMLEAAGKRLADKTLSHYFESFEQIMTENSSIPRSDDVVNAIGHSLNDTVEKATKINVANTVRDGYGWLRENIGRLPSTGAQWLQQLEPLILSQLTLVDPNQSKTISQMFCALIHQYRYDNPALQQMMQSFTDYLFLGTQDAHFVGYLNEAATLLAANGHSFGEVCTQFILAAPLYQTEHLTAEQRGILGLQLAQEANDVNKGEQPEEKIVGLGAVLSQAASRGTLAISRHFTEQYCLPLLNMQDVTARGYIRDGVTALHSQWLETPEVLIQQVITLMDYCNEGTLSPVTAAALDQLAMTLVAAGHDYGEVMTTLTMNNRYYLRFQTDPALSASFKTHLSHQLQAVVAAAPENRITKLNEILTNERQYAIDQTVQTLKPGQEVVNDYKNILDRNDIEYSADGLSEYVAQILVFNHPVFFRDLTQPQKLALQKNFREFFNEMQQSVSKMDERAVVKNYNRLKTFMICQPYIDMIMAGTSVSGHIPSIFLQLDPKEVRAAVAAHEVAAMLASAEGYFELSLQDSVKLFGKCFDQQFARSASKVEQGLRDIVNETFRKQAHDPAHPSAIWGEKTLDEAANYIADSSLQIAENRWQGTSDAYVRPVKYDDKSKLKAKLHSVEKELCKGFKAGVKEGARDSCVGAVWNNQQIVPAYMHMGVGSVVPLHNPFTATTYSLSLPAKGSAVTTANTALSTSSNMSQMAVRQERTATLPVVSALEERTPIFTPLLAANDIRHPHLDVPYWQNQTGFWGQCGRSLLTTAQDSPISPTAQDSQTTQASAKSRTKDSQAKSKASKKHSQTTQASAKNRTKDSQTTQANQQAIVTEMLSPSWNQGGNLKLVPELPDPLLGITPQSSQPLLPAVPPEPSFGEKLLDLVVGKANANPLVLVGMGTVVTAAGAILMQPHPEEEYAAPEHPEFLRDRFLLPYFGLDPIRRGREVASTTFPAVSSGTSKTETLVKQPGQPKILLTTPILGTKIYDFVYHRAPEKGFTGIYDDSYEKHQLRPGGKKALWDGASTNPIPNAAVGQQLLDSAYTSKDKPNQRFNYYDGKIIKFRSSNDGKWHSYEVNDDVKRQVGNKVLNQFLKDDLITKPEYNRLLKR